MSIPHILLTLFNVRIGHVENPKINALEWLSERLRLFRQITVPAIGSQSRRPDVWLVFFDVGTPHEIRDAVALIAKDLPFLHDVYCDGSESETIRQCIAGFVDPAATWLITTRIDNDDAIHPKLLETVQLAVRQGTREFINPLFGLIVTGPKAYRKRDYSSPFISLSEPALGYESVWVGPHHLLSTHGSIRQIMLRDVWVQVVHGGNLANHVRGLRAPRSSIDASLLPSALAQGLSSESTAELLIDNSVGAVVRYTKSAIRRSRLLFKA